MGIEYNRHMQNMADGTAHVQQQLLQEESVGHTFKNFASAVVPGNYQTRAYATTRLTEAHELLGLPDTVTQTVDLRMSRGQLINDPGRSFHAVIAESVLYGATADSDVMAEQLEHLLALATKPNVRLGILPTRARVHAAPMSHIDIVDDASVNIETMAVTITISKAPEVAMYLRMFDEFAQAAAYGEQAAAMIGRAQSGS
ncbi:hypothetical protein GCM10009839_13600 [Catenulispora yoronensis]|uniref:DUF5753 domain-containing protein n=1 Tax=Catenulispora yoronensis TaxID=450799 RepID=A0ABP5FAC7_9ACTN